MKTEYIIPHYFVSFCRRNLPIFQNVLFRYGQDIIYSTRTLIFQINSKRKSLFFIGPSGEVRKIALFIKIATSAVNLNPSAKNGSVHFLLGAMLPCSTPFCTSGQICPPVGKTLYTSGTKSPIDLKPGFKFKFLVCLETYLKKLVRSDHWGSLADLFGRCIWFLNSEFSTILDFRQKNRFFKKFWGLQF